MGPAACRSRIKWPASALSALMWPICAIRWRSADNQSRLAAPFCLWLFPIFTMSWLGRVRSSITFRFNFIVNVHAIDTLTNQVTRTNWLDLLRSKLSSVAVEWPMTQSHFHQHKSLLISKNLFFTFDFPLKGMTKVRRIESTSRISPVAATPHRNQLPEERQSAGNTEKQIVCWLLEFFAAKMFQFFQNKLKNY